jgi:hypothetical protein
MKAFFAAITLAIIVPATALGQTMDHTKMMHGKQAGMMMDGMLPQETGQSGFAAIQEIVAMLNANPATDWSKVDIEALRQHLIDMNNVTLGALVSASQTGDSMRFEVTGEGAVQVSIKRMVIAHAATMNGVDGWAFAAEPTQTGAVLTVTPPDPASMTKLKALGFIGILTLGMHHQQHHWMLANGINPHQ